MFWLALGSPWDLPKARSIFLRIREEVCSRIPYLCAPWQWPWRSNGMERVGASVQEPQGGTGEIDGASTYTCEQLEHTMLWRHSLPSLDRFKRETLKKPYPLPTHHPLPIALAKRTMRCLGSSPVWTMCACRSSTSRTVLRPTKYLSARLLSSVVEVLQRAAQ